MENKKAQTSALAGLPLVIITVLVAGIFLVLGIQLLNGFTSVTDNVLGTDVVNESGSANLTGYTLAQALTHPGVTITSISVLNASSGQTIPASNYTLVGNVLYNSTALQYHLVNISYSYTYGGVAYVSSNKTIFGIATFADFWSIIVLAVVIAIVIGILLVVFNQRRTK